MTQKAIVRVITDVHLNLNGADAREIHRNIHEGLSEQLGDGVMVEGTTAEVRFWRTRACDVPELDNAQAQELRDWMAERLATALSIEAMSTDDVIAEGIRYATLDPAEFYAEALRLRAEAGLPMPASADAGRCGAPAEQQDASYGEECVVKLANGLELRCPAYPEPCTYVRVVHGWREIGYWTAGELKDDPDVVLGAILGAANGAVEREPAIRLVLVDDPTVADRRNIRQWDNLGRLPAGEYLLYR